MGWKNGRGRRNELQWVGRGKGAQGARLSERRREGAGEREGERTRHRRLWALPSGNDSASQRLCSADQSVKLTNRLGCVPVTARSTTLRVIITCDSGCVHKPELQVYNHTCGSEAHNKKNEHSWVMLATGNLVLLKRYLWHDQKRRAEACHRLHDEAIEEKVPPSGWGHYAP